MSTVSFSRRPLQLLTMSVKGLVLPQILNVISHFEPFFPWIPTASLYVRRIRPYAFHVVQHRELLAYCFHWACCAVIVRFLPSKKCVLFETLKSTLFREEYVRWNTFARCAPLPPELVGHKYNLIPFLPCVHPVGRVATTFFRSPALPGFARHKPHLRVVYKGCLAAPFYFWNSQPRTPPARSEETNPATHQTTFCWPVLISVMSSFISRSIIPTSRNVLGSSVIDLPYFALFKTDWT